MARQDLMESGGVGGQPAEAKHARGVTCAYDFSCGAGGHDPDLGPTRVIRLIFLERIVYPRSAECPPRRSRSSSRMIRTRYAGKRRTPACVAPATAATVPPLSTVSGCERERENERAARRRASDICGFLWPLFVLEASAMDKLQKLEAAFARGAHDEANAILADLKVRAVARRRGVVIARRGLTLDPRFAADAHLVSFAAAELQGEPDRGAGVGHGAQHV